SERQGSRSPLERSRLTRRITGNEFHRARAAQYPVHARKPTLWTGERQIMMATIETKYGIGDVVWHASTVSETKTRDCPDCKGERKWSVTSPAGGEYSIACPRCAASFMSDRDLSLKYQ